MSLYRYQKSQPTFSWLPESWELSLKSASTINIEKYHFQIDCWRVLSIVIKLNYLICRDRCCRLHYHQKIWSQQNVINVHPAPNSHLLMQILFFSNLKPDTFPWMYSYVNWKGTDKWSLTYFNCLKFCSNFPVKFATFLKRSLLFNSFYCLFFF